MTWRWCRRALAKTSLRLTLVRYEFEFGRLCSLRKHSVVLLDIQMIDRIPQARETEAQETVA